MKQATNNESNKLFFDYPTGNDQEPKFIQNYYGMHKNIKVQFKNKKYRKIYQLLSRQAPEQDQYMTLYYQDLLISIIKLTRVHVIRQLSNREISQVQNKGIKALTRFYRMLVSDDCYLQGTYKINKTSLVALTLFLTFVIDFTTNLAAFFQTFDHIKTAKKLYNNLSKITTSVAQSSTSNPLILRKCFQNELFLSQLFYVRQCYPTAFDHLKKALRLLFNEIYIANMLKKVNKKVYKKQWNAQRFFSNLKKAYATLCLVLNKLKRFQLLFQFLTEILLIERQLNPMNKSRLITSPEWIKIYQSHFLQHKQLTEISSLYFDSSTIYCDYQTKKLPVNQRTVDSQNSEHEMRQSFGFPFASKQRRKLRTKFFERMENLPGRGSFNLDNIDDDRIMLFGENFWEAKRKMLQSTNEDSYTNIRQTIKNRTIKSNNNIFLKQNAGNSNAVLKRKRKKVQFKDKNKLQLENHVPYEEVCKNINKLVEENIKNDNLLKSKIYKLKAKQQSKSIEKLKSISEGTENQQAKILKQHRNIIMTLMTEHHKIKFQQLKSQQHHHENDKSSGLNLFRSIILKHKNTFGIKKVQLFQPQLKSTIKYNIPSSNQIESKATAVSRAKRNLEQFIEEYKIKLDKKKQYNSKQAEDELKYLKTSNKYKTILQVSNMEKSRLFQSTLNKWIQDNFEQYQGSDHKILNY